MPLHYDHQQGCDYAADIGFMWCSDYAAQADALCHEQGLTQKQWDALSCEYVRGLKWLFNPANQPLLSRIGLILRFCNPFAKKDS